MPAWTGLSERTSFQICSADGCPQSCPSRRARSNSMEMSSRAAPGGSSALRTRCTRRSLFVTVPSDSHQAAAAGKTTCASSAVLHQFIGKVLSTVRTPSNVEFTVDIDPVNMM